mmetsp:Transcript_65297/g.181118  ORF Transcript_65297/g.181118 Transcript_65297/m.181118 type:complete len:213 (+) Transcript_65297:1168-1806(+)
MRDRGMLNHRIADQEATLLATRRPSAGAGEDGDLAVRAQELHRPGQAGAATAALVASVEHVAMVDHEAAGLLDGASGAAPGALARVQGDAAVVAGQGDLPAVPCWTPGLLQASVVHGPVGHPHEARVGGAADGEVPRGAPQHQALDLAGALVRPIYGASCCVERDAEGHLHHSVLDEDLAPFAVHHRAADPARIAVGVAVVVGDINLSGSCV